MEKSGGSRLLQMQARFQQKQMAERELKIASLYEAQQARALGRMRLSPGETNSSGGGGGSPAQHAPVVPGKVRQMFEERRTKAGIDKSYPLQPIHNTERHPPRRVVTNGHSKVTSTTKPKVTDQKIRTNISNTHSKTQQEKSENVMNGSRDVNHNHETDIHTGKHKVSNRIGDHIQHVVELDVVDSYRLEDETFPEALAPVATPRSPEPRRPPRRSPVVKSSPTKPLQTTQPAPVAPPRRGTTESVSTTKSQGSMQKAQSVTVPRRPPVSSVKARSTTAGVAAAAAAGGAEGAACTVCGRRFAPDRLDKHEAICKKAHAKKRKPFDALKHRLAGTEAEPFIGRLRKSVATSGKKGTEAEPFIGKLRKSAPAASNTKVGKLNSSWRQKHEEFINAIRAAKQVQAHLNAGGKLSDLPPPPPSENPDYVQCPHCSRRFNQGAAERHIPKCASFQFNKPKPATKRR